MRLLVAEGDTATDRRRIAKSTGATFSESYAKVLKTIAPDSEVDIFAPADQGAAPPSPLETYHGVVITGSALNIYKQEPESLRQVDFVRAAFARGVPIFGSCWGLQVAAVAAGGEVERNPLGRELAFARKITLTDLGRGHAMHAGRAIVFDAPAVHGDVVTTLPKHTIVTAFNDMSRVQAAEIRFGRGVFWGVQYHPEYDFRDLAMTIVRYGSRLVEENFCRDPDDIRRYADDLATLHGDASRRDIAWRLGLTDDVLDPQMRRCEIANWIERQVRPQIGR